MSYEDLSKPLSKQQVANIDAKNVHKVLSRTILVDGFDVVYDLKKSHDAYLHDSVTGKEYLDLFSQFASWPISVNHPKIQNKEFIEKIGKIAIHNPANSDIYTVEMAQFVATFERVAKPKEFKHLFFVAGGTLAVENALKAAFDWKVRLNLSLGKGELGQKIIHFKEAFHGRSGYSLSLTNTQDPNKYKYFPLFNWPRIENPKAIFPLVGENLNRTIEAEKRAIAHITQVLEQEGDDVAAIILEPIQGEGGDVHFRSEFWHALRKLADKYNVLLIADEVQSGVGISGKFWAYEHYGIVPDIVCFGKKTQVCGIMSTSRIDTVKDNVFKVSSRINSTWGGSLVDMVRATRLLEIIEEENLVQNSATVGQYLLDKLLVLQKTYPQLISNARGKGLMCAFDVPNGAICGKVKSLAYERGAIIISCGSSTIRFRPVLDLKKQHVDELIRILNSVFADLSKQSKL